MCAACAMAAAAGASGARAYLQTHGPRWLTPRRLKRVTIGLCAAALGVSTIGFSGSSAPSLHHRWTTTDRPSTASSPTAPAPARSPSAG
jgi:hypothetical protein